VGLPPFLTQTYKGRRILEHKTDIGKSVHLAISMLVEGVLDRDSLGEDIYNYVTAAEKYIDDYREVPISVEETYGSIDLGYCCRPDFVGQESLVEWKTSYRISPAVEIQLAGQDKAVGRTSVRRVVQLCPDGQYNVTEFDPETGDRIFGYIWGIEQWKREFGSKTIRSRSTTGRRAK
jgi:hypothetical protein